MEAETVRIADIVPCRLRRADWAQYTESMATMRYCHWRVFSLTLLWGTILAVLACGALGSLAAAYLHVRAPEAVNSLTRDVVIVTAIVAYAAIGIVVHLTEKKRLRLLGSDGSWQHCQFVRAVESLERSNALVKAMRQYVRAAGEDSLSPSQQSDVQYLAFQHRNVVAGFRQARQKLDEYLRPTRLAEARAQIRSLPGGDVYLRYEHSR